jgi:hypothetical protein
VPRQSGVRVQQAHHAQDGHHSRDHATQHCAAALGSSGTRTSCAARSVARNKGASDGDAMCASARRSGALRPRLRLRLRLRTFVANAWRASALAERPVGDALARGAASAGRASCRAARSSAAAPRTRCMTGESCAFEAPTTRNGGAGGSATSASLQGYPLKQRFRSTRQPASTQTRLCAKTRRCVGKARTTCHRTDIIAPALPKHPRMLAPVQAGIWHSRSSVVHARSWLRRLSASAQARSRSVRKRTRCACIGAKRSTMKGGSTVCAAASEASGSSAATSTACSSSRSCSSALHCARSASRSLRTTAASYCSVASWWWCVCGARGLLSAAP